MTFSTGLCSDIIEVPTLRCRLDEAPEELHDLVAHVVAVVVGRPDEALAGEVTEALLSELGPDYPWPGNVRELEQRSRRVLLTGRCGPEICRGGRGGPGGTAGGGPASRGSGGAGAARRGTARCCTRGWGSYEAVGRRVGLDRRTVKKHVDAANEP